MDTSFLQTFFNIFGGLALFLFAMKLLSNGLQNIIGKNIELVLRKMTDRPYKGMVVGALVTFLTQSSSITVLTLIGLVNVGVLNLSQGVGILLGAEIGTTITAQLVSFKIGHWYFVPIVVGFVLSQVNRKNLTHLGKAIFSFGLLLMSMELIKKGAVPLRESPTVLHLFETFGSHPITGIIAGILFTGITSSSSATTSLVVALGAANAISLPAAIALMLGANIGTTILELIAIVGMSLTAKRVAIAQALINVLGVVMIYPFLRPFAALAAGTSETLAHQIANSHTIFNVGSSLFFLTLTGTIVALTKKLLPGEAVKVERGTKYLDHHVLNLPHIAITHTVKEIQRMGRITTSMFDDITKAIAGKNGFEEIIDKKENHVDLLEAKIFEYLSLIAEHELDHDTATQINQLNHGITDIERASDHLKRAAQSIYLLRREKLNLTTRQKARLKKFAKDCRQTYNKALRSFIKSKLSTAQQIPLLLNNINAQKNELNGKPIRNARKSQLYSRAIHHLERAAHHGENLADIVTSGI